MTKNERLYHDLATAKMLADVTEKVNKPNWKLIVDEAAGVKFSIFHNDKADVIDNTSA